MPLQPKTPNVPVFGGMKGCQLAVLDVDRRRRKMNSSTTVTLMATMTELNGEPTA